MNKGFTLIELLAVVTLIAVLSIIIIPNITENINNKKEEISEVNKKILESATDIYIERNANNYAYTYEANGSTYCIPIQSLINSNILETPLKNEKGKEIDYSKIIKATYSYTYNGFEYEIVKNNECTETVNYVSKPELQQNMIPVVYDETNNVWIKADITSKWYNYSEKEWANAVLVNEHKTENVSDSKSRYEYLQSPSGTKITEEDILGYFVWIPRFRYQLFDQSETTTINIVFENRDTLKSKGTQKGQWLTHPAFSQNEIELTGIWISKYESSNKDNNINIKPNKTPWTNIKFNDAYNISNNITNENNIYGLSNINTHLTHNDEWSAITYLTSSKYGINEKIEPSTKTITGQSTSTTGNITGIYDMSGVSKEFVVLENELENSLGYSLAETNSWYDETNSFSSSRDFYLTRGNTSIFNYLKSTGEQDNNTSFRITLLNHEILIPDFYGPNIVTSGDGLYESTLEEGKYIYRGANPNNHIWLDENGNKQQDSEELYRIMSFESDGTIKVIRNTVLPASVWDTSITEEGARNTDDNTYCIYSGTYYGCNVWGNQNNIYLDNEKIGNEFYYKYYTNPKPTSLTIQPSSGTVMQDSTLNRYLNNEWLPSTSLGEHVINHNFYVGGVYYQSSYKAGDKGLSMETQEEKAYTWNGNIGLMSVTEYVSASTNPSCVSVYSNYYYNINYYYDTTPDDGVSNKVQTLKSIDEWPCSNRNYNWMSMGFNEWTISPLTANHRSIWYLLPDGSLSSKNSSDTTTSYRPVFHLKSSVRLAGSGTINNPYQIVTY